MPLVPVSEQRNFQATNSELTAQLSSIKKPGQTDTTEMRALTARAVNAERRLANTLNQLAACEEKIGAMNQKTTIADSKWEARVKEYESRLKTAEERIKRERQGGKERVAELENSIKYLLSLASHRATTHVDLQGPSTAAWSC
jgi:chromosome segregation ATPase